MGKVLVIIAWLILGWAYYCLDCRYDKECCGAVTEVVEKDDGSEGTNLGASSDGMTRKLGPLVFNYSGMNPITNDGFDGYRDSVLAGLGENQILEIAGLYCKEEEGVEGHDNLGLARAEETKKLFSQWIDPERIRVRAIEVDASECDKDGPFESVRFDYKIATEKIKEIEDRTLIYFPQNSTDKLNDAEVEAYLNDVADVVRKNGKTVHLTGHTDRLGSADSNYRLGLRRAQVIQNYLLSKGVPAGQVKVQSKGETDPVDTNDTAAGRANNRRTELVIK